MHVNCQYLENTLHYALSAYSSTLTMEAVNFFETSVNL
jgi:hypothetical protein